VIAGVIRSKIRQLKPGLRNSESDDLRQEAIAQLLVELRRLREQPELHLISDLRPWPRVIAHRTCADGCAASIPNGMR
jgi:DNA-directed RNA polymerase specialized sigma24 family protein